MYCCPGPSLGASGATTRSMLHTHGGRVPPYSVGSDGKSGPVRVDVGVMIEKVRIDTVQQVATIKWWLRQSWKVRTDIAEGEI